MKHTHQSVVILSEFVIMQQKKKILEKFLIKKEISWFISDELLCFI